MNVVYYFVWRIYCFWHVLLTSNLYILPVTSVLHKHKPRNNRLIIRMPSRRHQGFLFGNIRPRYSWGDFSDGSRILWLRANWARDLHLFHSFFLINFLFILFRLSFGFFPTNHTYFFDDSFRLTGLLKWAKTREIFGKPLIPIFKQRNF